MAAGPPKVFISYSHDSPEHEQRVLELANRLRRDGIDCTIDQYVVVPLEGWPRWMDKQIRDSDFVVMVCTETYYQRVGHTSSVRAMAVTPDGRHVVSGSLDHTLRVWDLATGETKTTLQAIAARSMRWQSHPMVATWSPAPTTRRYAFGI